MFGKKDEVAEDVTRKPVKKRKKRKKATGTKATTSMKQKIKNKTD